MVYLLRALYIGVPLGIILIGTYAGSANSASESERSTAQAVRIPAHGLIVAATADDMDRMHRIALKQEVAADLLDGTLTFQQALSRFRQFAEADFNDARLAQQLVAFVKAAAAKYPGQHNAAIAKIESEINKLLAEQ